MSYFYYQQKGIIKNFYIKFPEDHVQIVPRIEKFYWAPRGLYWAPRGFSWVPRGFLYIVFFVNFVILSLMVASLH